ncbi:MAG: hypothetical protein NTX23_01310 [Candidatus Bipolaricaulota bacterium]|nr:hypothetical protein [Candidatus Bipolaricaulota bacterium]
MNTLRRLAARAVRNTFGGRFAKIREINEKFRTPHVKMTPAVKFALLCLRLYLFLLVGLLIFKFYTLVASG